MFNMLDEELFVCQSLLKERRRPPTGGLMEALEESLGRRVFTPPSPVVGSKTTLEPLEFVFLFEEKRLVTAWEELPP